MWNKFSSFQHFFRQFFSSLVSLIIFLLRGSWQKKVGCTSSISNDTYVQMTRLKREHPQKSSSENRPHFVRFQFRIVSELTAIDNGKSYYVVHCEWIIDARHVWRPHTADCHNCRHRISPEGWMKSDFRNERKKHAKWQSPRRTFESS